MGICASRNEGEEISGNRPVDTGLERLRFPCRRKVGRGKRVPISKSPRDKRVSKCVFPI